MYYKSSNGAAAASAGRTTNSVAAMRRANRELGYRGFGIDRRRRAEGPQRSQQRRTGPARTLAPQQIEMLFDLINERSNVPASDRLKIELSFRAGLRVQEIALLRLEDVTDATGKLSREIRIRAENSKTGRERCVPMHPRVAAAFHAFRREYPDMHQFALSRRFSKIWVQSTHALTVWFGVIYQCAGLEGCSSHSGRRTMITQLARKANEVGASLRDVQIIAGHARLDTTERYIEPSKNLALLINTLDFLAEEDSRETSASLVGDSA